jgi:hypothetical protein
MAQVTEYATLYAFMVPELPDCPEPMLLQALQRSGRLFCQATQAWREDLEVLPVVAWQQDYPLTHDYSGSADLHRVLALWLNGALQDPETYELYEADTIRWKSGYVPNDELDNRVLVCGTAGITDVADWQDVTAGSVTVTLDDTTYALTGLDFSSCSDMDGVASVIQTALRAAQEENVGFVRWHTDHLVLWVNSGTCSYLTAGTAGTDISGAGYMNGLSGGTGVSLAPAMLLHVAFRPHVHADVLPDWFIERWAEAIYSGAIAELARKPNRPYTDLDTAAYYRLEWKRGIIRAKDELTRGLVNRTPTLTA